MDYYFLVITIIDIFVLAIMSVFTRYSETLRKQQKRWFVCSFMLISFISAFEVISVAVNNASPEFRWINILSNYLGFGLTPAVPMALSFTLAEEKISLRPLITQTVYLILLGISIPFGLVFQVDANNDYMRGEHFGLYVLAYSISIIYLVVITLQSVNEHQNRSRNMIYLVAGFLLVSTMIQVILPHLHTSWLSASLLAILYFVYCNIMWQQLNGLTGLLNQTSYLNKTSFLKRKSILIVFDLDNFKYVNDNYGHLVGDECLKEVAAGIKKAYSGSGLCYRIGGDEFCALLDIKTDLSACAQVLISELETRRKSLEVLPYVSMGVAEFRPGDNINKVKDLADNNMYEMKRIHKEKVAAKASEKNYGKNNGEIYTER